MDDRLIEFRYAWDDGADVLVVSAEIGGWVAGSVALREHSERQVLIGRLYVEPQWRCQRVGRRIMEHVLTMYPRADKWLYAEPYAAAGQKPGPPESVLRQFYYSLGFLMTVDEAGRMAMMRPAEVDCGDD